MAKKIDEKNQMNQLGGNNESRRDDAQWRPAGGEIRSPSKVFPFFLVYVDICLCVWLFVVTDDTQAHLSGDLRRGGGGPWARFSFLELWLFLFLLFSLLQQNKGKILSKSNKQKWKFSIVSGFSSSFSFYVFWVLLETNKKWLRATFSLLLVLCSTAIETVTTDARTHRGITKKITNLFFFPFVISLLVAPLCPFETFSSKWERREALGKRKNLEDLRKLFVVFFIVQSKKLSIPD